MGMGNRRMGPITKQDGIGQGHSAWCLAQRPSGQQQAVAQPALIKQDEFEIPRQPLVLQAIVGNDQIGLG